MLMAAAKSKVDTGVGFLDHMLELFAKHGFFDLAVEATGDLHVDCPSHGGGCGHLYGEGIQQRSGRQSRNAPLRKLFRANV